MLKLAADENFNGRILLAPIGRVIEDLLLVAAASSQDEWEGRTLYIPL